MRKVLSVIAAVGFVLLNAQSGRTEAFPRPAQLERAVGFWRDIFTAYSRNQVVLHDAVDLTRIYKVLDYRAYADEGWASGELDSFRKTEVEAEMQSLRDLLLRLAELGPEPAGLTEEEQRIYDMFKDDPSPDRFLEAAGDRRLHSQSGLKERFQEGLEVSRAYLPEMESIFREQGLPTELTRIPLIESCFNVRAYSKVGAAGIWQFMPSTGRLYLTVGDRVDERRDPIIATRAAAQFLSRIYDRLGEWPLAITSYNHGPEGIARAVDAVGSTDIDVIVRDYRGPNFGFASRNFYVEFLAALDVDRNAKAYFPSIAFRAPQPLSEQYLTRSLDIDAAARGADIGIDELAALNPALTPPVVDGRSAIPAGYRLRLPPDKAGAFDAWMTAYEDERIEREARERQEAAARAEEAREAREAAAAQRAAARTARATSPRRGVSVARSGKGAKAEGVTSVPVSNRVGRATKLQKPKSGRGSRT